MQVALVLGNEVIGVDAEVLELCDRIVEVGLSTQPHTRPPPSPTHACLDPC